MSSPSAVSQARISLHPCREAPRLYAVYVLNLVSALAVVFLHTSLSVNVPLADSHFMLNVFLQALCIFAVPIFFAISGMNLLDYRNRMSTKDFFLKRLRRVGVALLFGSVLCYVIFGLFPSSFYGASGAPLSFVGFIKGFLSNSINDTYWFFYTLIYFYLLTPLLSLVAQNKRALQYILLLTCIAGICVPLLMHLGVSSRYLTPLFSWGSFTNSSLLYFVGGYYVKTYLPTPKNTHAWRYALGFLASAGGMFLVTLALNTPPKESYVSYVASISSPLCVLEAFFLFQFVRSFESQLQALPKATKRALAFASRGALGVYLIQILFINCLVLVIENPVLKGLFVYACTLLLSLAFIWCKDKVLGAFKL